jgi:hypothetical protein
MPANPVVVNSSSRKMASVGCSQNVSQRVEPGGRYWPRNVVRVVVVAVVLRLLSAFCLPVFSSPHPQPAAARPRSGRRPADVRSRPVPFLGQVWSVSVWGEFSSPLWCNQFTTPVN